MQGARLCGGVYSDHALARASENWICYLTLAGRGVLLCRERVGILQVSGRAVVSGQLRGR